MTQAQAVLELPEIPDDDSDFTPELARKIIAKYQAIIRATTAAAQRVAPDELQYLRDLALNAIREYPVASGLYVDSDGQAGYGSLKAMRIFLGIVPDRGPSHTRPELLPPEKTAGGQP